MDSTTKSLFFAIAFFFCISISSADVEPYNIAGNWYVVAAKGYNFYLPLPRCWNIRMVESSPGVYHGNSNFINADGNYINVRFNATRTETHSEEVQIQYLTVIMTISDTGITLVDTMSFQWSLGDDAQVLSYRYKTDPKLHFWDALFLQRSTEVLANMPSADFFHDTRCSQNSHSYYSYEI